MEEYSKYVFLAFAVAASLYRSFQKKKKASTKSVVKTSNDEEYESDLNPRSQMFADLEPVKGETEIKPPVVVRNTSASKTVARQLDSEKEVEESQELEEMDDFDLRKAVIYSEILKPPYI